jgi:mRNA-degrading endonuclease RelE of RelBE toxin-antitoxin system
MKATFVELESFSEVLPDYLNDEQYRDIQEKLMENPQMGDVIQGTGGMRKARFGDPRRQKGKRGGLRVIYYFWVAHDHFLMLDVYDKDEQDDLTAAEKKDLKSHLADVLQRMERRMKK